MKFIILCSKSLKRNILFKCQRLITTNSNNMASNGSLVAVSQMTSTSDKRANFDTSAKLVSQAAAAGAKMVFLPEGCDYIAESKDESLSLAESLAGPTVEGYKQLAKTHNIWLSLGGLHIKDSGNDKMSNTHLLIDSEGNEVSRYAKTHLFSVQIAATGIQLREEAYVEKGHTICQPSLTPIGNLALGICYDVRFAEFSIIQRQLGAEILTFPSAFTVTTGLAHWEALLRARAIETQCYVVAAAQTGQHNKKRSSYGHAMIIDPWGAVLAQVSEGTGIALAYIDLSYLHKVRTEMPVMSHRRHDLYHISHSVQQSHMPSLVTLQIGSSPHVTHQFGSVEVTGSCVFLRSPQSLAFVNKKPVTFGHTLVCPARPAPRLRDLRPGELSDLVQLTQGVVKLTRHVVGSGQRSGGGEGQVQVALQDGEAAGQTIKHVHLHIVPLDPKLVSGDGGGGLEGHEQSEQLKWRDVDEMEQEASKYKLQAHNICPQLAPKNSTLPGPLEEVSDEFEGINIGSSVTIPKEAIFFKSRHCVAFVAPNPILPGHVYVTGLKITEGGFGNANVDMAVDLFLTVQLVQSMVEEHFEAIASTVCLIDNKPDSNEALLVQIIPRRKDDLTNNDDIYRLIYKHQMSSSQWQFDNNILNTASTLRTRPRDGL